jgi:hypothetical protein
MIRLLHTPAFGRVSWRIEVFIDVQAADVAHQPDIVREGVEQAIASNRRAGLIVYPFHELPGVFSYCAHDEDAVSRGLLCGLACAAFTGPTYPPS